MAEKKLPPLPSGSFNLNDLSSAKDFDAEIKRQLAANKSKSPAPSQKAPEAKAEIETPPPAKSGK